MWGWGLCNDEFERKERGCLWQILGAAWPSNGLYKNKGAQNLDHSVVLVWTNFSGLLDF